MFELQTYNYKSKFIHILLKKLTLFFNLKLQINDIKYMEINIL
jgi:hypothetical protein